MCFDQRVGMMAAQNFRVEHPRQHDVIGKLRLARALCPRIDFAEWFADYLKGFSIFRLLAIQFLLRSRTG